MVTENPILQTANMFIQWMDNKGIDTSKIDRQELYEFIYERALEAAGLKHFDYAGIVPEINCPEPKYNYFGQIDDSPTREGAQNGNTC